MDRLQRWVILTALALLALASLSCGSAAGEATPAAEEATPVDGEATPAGREGILPRQLIRPRGGDASLAFTPQALMEVSITPAEATDNVGKTIKVCGTVVEVRPEPELVDRLWQFNFDSPHPDVLFFALVQSPKDWQYPYGDWPASPETFYLGKNVCADGAIQLWRGIPYIVATYAFQLEVVE